MEEVMILTALLCLAGVLFMLTVDEELVSWFHNMARDCQVLGVIGWAVLTGCANVRYNTIFFCLRK
jgi:hypothetical protein